MGSWSSPTSCRKSRSRVPEIPQPRASMAGLGAQIRRKVIHSRHSRVRHDPCSVGEPMFPAPRRRSSIALVVVATLLGVAAAPLTLCAAEREKAHCPVKAAQQAKAAQPEASHHTCQEQPEAPPTALSCCCDETNLPVTPANAPNTVGAAPIASPSIVDVVVLRRELRPATEVTGLPARHRPLFTLFSSFLL